MPINSQYTVWSREERRRRKRITECLPLVPLSLKAVYKMLNDELIAAASAKYRTCIVFDFDCTESAIEPQKFLILYRKGR